MSEKWNAEEIRMFLDKYQEFECLWNIRHTDYMNRSKRDVALRELRDALIELEVNIPNLDFLRKKIKTLKCVYRQEFLKVEKSKKSGAELEDIYRPRLSWFKRADSFLRDVTIHRASPTYFDISDISQREAEDISNDADAQDQRTRDTFPMKKDVTSCKRKLCTEESHVDKVNVSLSKLEDIFTNCRQDDEFDNYGRHIASQLRMLPIRNAIILQDKIQSLISQERLSCLPDNIPTLPSDTRTKYINANEDETHESDNILMLHEKRLEKLAENIV